MKRFFIVLGCIVLVAVLVFGGGILLANNGIDNPVSDAVNGATNAAANAALDASGVKEKADSALRSNAGRIAEKSGLPKATVDGMIDDLDIRSWEVTTLPRGAKATGSANVDLDGTAAKLTTYDDPSVVTVDAGGASVTLKVPPSAQDYIRYLEYL